ncbi:MAG: ABC transporter permease [Thermoproteota archaeon]
MGGLKTSSSKPSGLKGVLREVLSYKSAILGLALLLFLISLSVYTVVTIPLPEAIRLWKSSEAWSRNPRNAQPEWIELFSGKRLPRTIMIPLRDVNATKILLEDGKLAASWIVYFNYDYDDFPSEVIVFFNSSYAEKPVVDIYWIRPDGDEIFLKKHTLRRPDDRLYLSNDLGLELKIGNLFESKIGVKPNFMVTVEKGLFAEYSQDPRVLKGRYGIRFEATLSKSDVLNAETVVYGSVYGLAGTDHLRRPLIIGLLWGAPIAMSFGLTTALLTTALSLIIGTISGWYGGKVDLVIQRIVEINAILPFLPILILLTTFYRIDLFVILLSVVALSIFSLGIKGTRILVMQIKTYPYVEAAQVYGASNMRLILFYVIPKILPPVVPGMISSVPGFVFLEAGLSYLGLGDPFLPTWGKIISDAQTNGAFYKGMYYWVLEPAFLLILTAIAFALIGTALEKIVNPKLKEL